MTLARARELAILSLLKAHPAHGYDISRAVAAGPLVHLGLSRPAVYAILDRFEKRGWIVGEKTVSGSYPDKTVMSLTEDGRVAQEAALDAVSNPPGPPIAPLMAVMLAHDAGADLSAALLNGMIEDRRSRLADLLADEAHSETATGRLARNLIEAELSVLKAMAPEA
jgi:DNA-binding PadR family transcriptional regulator